MNEFWRYAPYEFEKDGLTEKDIDDMQQAFKDGSHDQYDLMRLYELPLWKIWKILKDNLCYSVEPLKDTEDGYTIQDDEDEWLSMWNIG